MGNNEPAVDQSDLRIRGSYGLKSVRLSSRSLNFRTGGKCAETPRAGGGSSSMDYKIAC